MVSATSIGINIWPTSATCQFIWGGFKLEIGFEWSTIGISIGTYFILNIYINDLDDDITSKVLKFAEN